MEQNKLEVTEKKPWTTPKVEHISKGAVASGGAPFPESSSPPGHAVS